MNHLRVLAMLTMLPLLGAAGPKAPPPVAGGAGQRASLEGCLGQWLFNGVWRFRVNKLTLVPAHEEELPGYDVSLELRNGTGQRISAEESGAGGLDLIGSDGIPFEVNTTRPGAEFSDKDLPPGGIAKTTLRYLAPADTTNESLPKATKFLFAFNKDNNFDKQLTKNPSFRVNLTCAKT